MSAVTFQDGVKISTGRIDLNKGGCFILETKHCTDTPDQERKATRAEFGLTAEKRCKGHAGRVSAKREQIILSARKYVCILNGNDGRSAREAKISTGPVTCWEQLFRDL